MSESSDSSSVLPDPPVAPTRPHTWQRPTGPVDDPYAWLRNREDPDTIAYLEAENAYAGTFFDQHAELVESLFTEIKSRVQETDQSVPVQHGPWWYVTRTVEGQSYPVFCRGASIDDASDAVVLDCNVEADGHDFFDVHAVDPSPDHTLLAWSADVDGGERYTLRVRDLATGEDLPDELTDTSSWGGLAWSSDGKWLFYARPDEQMRPHQIWLHRLGTPVGDDHLLIEEADERYYLDVSSTRSERWIVITSASRTTTEVRVLPADDPTAEPVLVRARSSEVEYSIDDWGERFVVLTNLDAPDFRVMTAPFDAPGEWTELIAHEPGRRLTSAEPFAAHLVLHEWSAAQPRIWVLFLDGSESRLDFGAEPHDIELGGNPQWDTTAVRLSYQSLTTPLSIYDVDVVTGERTLRKQTPTPGVDLDRYVSTRTWATAPDGTAVPVDVVRHVDTPVDGTAPAVMYAYGSYEASMPPWFSVARLSLLDQARCGRSCIPVAVASSGATGTSTASCSTSATRSPTRSPPPSTSSRRAGPTPPTSPCAVGSAGGLLVGACITMRPDLYSTAVAEVPFVDVVTTMSDATLPLTANEWEEWGDPRLEPYASYMLSYSPYDNVRPATYPALYVTAGLNDPRVSYHEPAKWVARLRSVGAGRDRILVLRTEMGAGHGGPSGRYEAWRDEARTLAFLLTTF